MSRPPRLPRRTHDRSPLTHCLAFGRKTKVPSLFPPKDERHMTALVMLLMTTSVPSADLVAQPPPASWASPGDGGPQASGGPRRVSRLRALFSRRSQGPQQPAPVAVSGAPVAAGPLAPPVITPGRSPSSADTAVTVSPAPPMPQGMPSRPQPACACGARPGGALQPAPVAVSGAPVAAGPITPPGMSQGPQQQPGGAAVAPPGGAGRLVPVPVSGAPVAAGPITPPGITSEPPMAVTVSPAPPTPPQGAPRAGSMTFPAGVGTAGPSPAMSRPGVTTPPAVPPGMQRMPTGRAGPF